MPKKHAPFLIMLCFLLSPVFAKEKKELPLAVKWVRHSVEYAALCEQVYRNAWQVVSNRAETMDKDWVAVFDVDETVLDNSLYAVERAAADSGFSQASWNAWVSREEGTPIPGAKAFIDKVRGLGPKAHIAFLTNRKSYNEAATISNLKKIGLFEDGDTMLTRRNRDDSKLKRRQCLENGTGRCKENGPLVILALFGDNIRDFFPMKGEGRAQEYRSAELHGDKGWGLKYFVLPNPTYGSWENNYQ